MFKYNIALSIFFALLAGGIYCYCTTLPPGMSGEAGPAYWPSFLAVVLFILAVTLLAETLWKRRSERRRDGPPPAEAAPIDYASPGMRRLYAMLGALALFSVTLKLVGFLVAAAVFIPVGMAILGEKRPLVLGVFTLAVPATVYALFFLILGIKLP